MANDQKKELLTIEILDQLHDSGELRKLVNSGLISVNVIQWRKIFHAYHFRVGQINSSHQAVSDVAEVFGVSERTVYKTIERLKM